MAGVLLCEPTELYNILNQHRRFSRLSEPHYLSLLGEPMEHSGAAGRSRAAFLRNVACECGWRDFSPAMRPCCWGISASLFHGAVLLVALSSFTQSRKQQRVAFIATARSNKLSACGNSGLNCISLSVNCSRDGLPLPRGGSADRQPLDVSKHLCPSRCQHPQMAPCVAMCLG